MDGPRSGVQWAGETVEVLRVAATLLRPSSAMLFVGCHQSAPGWENRRALARDELLAAILRLIRAGVQEARVPGQFRTPEGLDTRRGDAGVVARFPFGSARVSLRCELQ